MPTEAPDIDVTRAITMLTRDDVRLLDVAKTTNGRRVTPPPPSTSDWATSTRAHSPGPAPSS